MTVSLFFCPQTKAPDFTSSSIVLIGRIASMLLVSIHTRSIHFSVITTSCIFTSSGAKVRCSLLRIALCLIFLCFCLHACFFAFGHAKLPRPNLGCPFPALQGYEINSLMQRSHDYGRHDHEHPPPLPPPPALPLPLPQVLLLYEE